MSEWQPIETAPRNGRPIFCWSHDAAFCGMWVGYWNALEGRWRDLWVSDEDEDNVQPTHWMPLPEPPNT